MKKELEKIPEILPESSGDGVSPYSGEPAQKAEARCEALICSTSSVKRGAASKKDLKKKMVVIRRISMRTIEEKIRYSLRGLLFSDEPMKEAVLICAKQSQIKKAAAELYMPIWLKERAVVDKENRITTIAWWVGLRVLPQKKEKYDGGEEIE